MALFTDAAVVTLDDLLPFETSLPQVSSSHAINVDSKITLAKSAISDRLMLWLLNAGTSDPQWVSRRSLGLSTVVVTPPLQRWLCLDALARFFAEAYNIQLNTRYQGKWTEYTQEAKNACDLLSSSGIGVVNRPLPMPGTPLISVQTGNAPASSIFVGTSWVGADGSEGALSSPNGAVLPDSSSIAVAMAEGALQAPASAIGWNIYAGTVADSLTQQNSSALAIGSTWQLPASGIQAGSRPSEGQQPDFVIALSKQIRRG